MGHYEQSLTYDQLTSVLLKTKDVWYKPSDEFHIQFSREECVFNILLHFSKDLLRLIGEEPTCSYQHLLRWHDITSLLGEDLFVTSYLASRDLSSDINRTHFLWNPHLKHDNLAVNNILGRELSELHAHLTSSSDVFTLNWILLMNCCDISQQTDARVILAAQIRATLYDLLRGNYKLSYDKEIAKVIKDIEGESGKKMQKLKAKIASLKFGAYQFRMNLDESPQGIHLKSEGEVIDYAIRDNSVNEDVSNGDISIITLHSGERWLLYGMFKLIYNNQASPFQEYIFLTYLQLKAQYRNTIVESEGHIGYTSFVGYETRAKQIIKNKSYRSIVNATAIGSYFLVSDNRYVEVRIPAQTELFKIRDYIQSIEKAVHDCTFIGRDKWKVHYILSISKTFDEKELEKKIRNSDVRQNCMKTAQAIHDIIKSPREEWQNKIVGIDACGSEFNCRPEVFAQAYRFVAGIYTGNYDCMSIRQTYHVGEDYYDIIDGLRAIDEVIRFLQFGNGTRIGHALVLGENVAEYYLKRHYTVVMPLQILVDNLAWLYHESALVCYELQPLRNILLEKFDELYHKLVKDTPLTSKSISIENYYKSWTLRGDNPAAYNGGVFNAKNISTTHRQHFDSYSLNPDTDARNSRINNIDAAALYWEYHNNRVLRANGCKTEEWKLGNQLPALIDAVRELMLEKVEKRHIAIECAPTSNVRIGGLKRYDQHPIVKFFNFDINTPFKEHGLSVSINTDDKGIFSTSLEREYSLISIALEKCTGTDRINNPRRIYDWLDRVRQMGNENRFHRIDNNI